MKSSVTVSRRETTLEKKRKKKRTEAATRSPRTKTQTRARAQMTPAATRSNGATAAHGSRPRNHDAKFMKVLGDRPIFPPRSPVRETHAHRPGPRVSSFSPCARAGLRASECKRDGCVARRKVEEPGNENMRMQKKKSKKTEGKRKNNSWNSAS